jgi:hypothetical protein
MRRAIQLDGLLKHVGDDQGGRLTVFATINLGLIEILTNGSMSASEVVDTFYNADNCLYVRDTLRNKLAERIMSHGVQLADLFEGLPIEEAQREFLHELAAMKALCIKLIESERLAA